MIVLATIALTFGILLVVQNTNSGRQTGASIPDMSASLHLAPIVSTAVKTYSIGGIVKTITPSQISIAVTSVDVRTVNITENIKITRIIPVDPATAAKEADAIQKYMQNPKAFTPEQVASFKPSIPQEVAATLADIKEGMHVVVVARDDTTKTKEINAIEVRIQ